MYEYFALDVSVEMEKKDSKKQHVYNGCHFASQFNTRSKVERYSTYLCKLMILFYAKL
jgi:hypothetical protein